LPLVFTRRIHNPKGGARLTGKAGPWSIGYFGIDDASPGQIVPRGDPMVGTRAWFNILRVNRELGTQSSVGFIVTDRELPCHNCATSLSSGEAGFNRVGALDYRWKIGKNWQINGQAAASDTKFIDGTRASGQAIQQYAEYSSRTIEFNTFVGD